MEETKVHSEELPFPTRLLRLRRSSHVEGPSMVGTGGARPEENQVLRGKGRVSSMPGMLDSFGDRSISREECSTIVRLYFRYITQPLLIK